MQIHTKFERPETRFQTFTQPSLTVPDQTIPIKTMVQRYAKGMPFNAPDLGGIFTDDEVAQDFEKLDLVEQEESLLSAADELTDIKGKITKDKQNKAAEAKKIAENNEQLAKELEELKAKLKQH
jgi:hypothetical protein